jgi:predicted permease
LRSLLVAGEVAVSTLFLISAGLLAHGLIRSQSANVGFEVRSVYPMALIHSSDPAKSNVLRQQQLDRLETLPQIQSVALVDFVPLGGTWTAPVKLVDNKAAAASAPNTTLARHISSSFLPALGIRVVRGRNFSREEARSGVPLAIVSTAMARSAWPNEDPIGKKFELETQRIPVQWSQFEVVGVAADVRSANITRVDPAMVYLPTSADKLYNYFVLLRIPGDPHEAMGAIRSTLEQLDGHPRPGFSLTSLEGGVVQTQILMAKTFTFSATVLAIMALLLASIGVYGVMAFLASQREKEVGIHLALGATRRDVLLLMLSQGMRPVIVGGTIGFVGALAISGLMRSLLVFPGSVDILSGAHWFDPMTFIGLSCLLATIALIACYLPARRVTQIDPLAALRHE